MNKLTSGRFIFTIVTACVFGWASYSKVLTNEQIVSVITLVVAFYFFKKPEKE